MSKQRSRILVETSRAKVKYIALFDHLSGCRAHPHLLSKICIDMQIETAETAVSAVLCSTWLRLGEISGTLADVLLISGMIMRHLQLEAS